MLLNRIFNDNVMLSRQELEELVIMYLSGKYFEKELLEEFGLNYYQLKAYMAIAYELGLTNRKEFRMNGAKERAHYYEELAKNS